MSLHSNQAIYMGLPHAPDRQRDPGVRLNRCCHRLVSRKRWGKSHSDIPRRIVFQQRIRDREVILVRGLLAARDFRGDVRIGPRTVRHLSEKH